MKAFCTLYLGAVLSLSSVSAFTVNAEEIAKKKQEIDQKIDTFKQTKEAVIKKIKEKKKKWKKKFSLLSSLDQMSPSDVAYLLQECQKGSLEAYTFACHVLGVDHLDGVEEALYSYLEPHLVGEKPIYDLIPCGIYIGDDGLEYDDGEEEQTYENVSFYCLPLHQWEKKVIEKIISSMAEKSLAQLLIDKKEMEKKGDQIHHVHPLRFLGFAFSQTYLKTCMKQFRTNSFKWNNFIDGLSQKMKEEAACDNLLKHLEGFCEFLQVDYSSVLDYAQKGHYEGMVDYLLSL